jgi:hypothetical protein
MKRHQLSAFLNRPTKGILFGWVVLLSLIGVQRAWSQCANTVPATTLDNANADPYTYTGLANGMSMTITNVTDAVVNVTANGGYRLGGATSLDRVYKITFSKPVSCATLYFSEMDYTTVAERITGLQTNDSLAVLSFTNTSTGGSSHVWDAVTKTITPAAGSTGSSSSSKLTFTANVAFTEIYFLYDLLSVSSAGGVLLTQVDFTESTIAPVSLCKCSDNLNCGLNSYANETAAFAAFDGQLGTGYNLESQNLLHSIAGHSYPICVDYTTGPLETRIGVRQTALFTGACTGFARVYAVNLESDCTTPATFLGANFTGGTRGFQYYTVQPNTTYRLCATLSTNQCHERSTGSFQPEYKTSTWYVYNALPPAAFAFNCTSVTATGSFAVNNTSSGSVTVPVTGATAGPAAFSVSGSGFSGTLTTTLTAGQTSVVIPITYDGTGTLGTKTLTITSAQGTGSCSATAVVRATPACVVGASLWLKADAGVTPATGTLTTWADQVGTNTFTKTGTLTTNANVVNFNPTVYFNGSSFLTGNTSITVADFYVVAKPTTSGTNHGILSSTGSQVGSNFESNAFTLFSPVSGGLGYATQAPGGINTQWHIHNFDAGQAPTVGQSDGRANSDHYGSAAQQPFSSAPLVGRNVVKGNLTGDIAEVIVYPSTNGTNTAANRQKIISYLAIKYGITIGHNYLNPRGQIIYDITTNGSNITGIGRDNCEDLHQKQSKSVNMAALVTMGLTSIDGSNALNTNNLTDTTYSIFGDNNAALTWQSTETSLGKQRVAREWKMTETGTVATLKIQIPDNGSPLSTKLPMEVASTVWLMVDADGDFTTGATLIPMTLVGTNWECSYNFPTGTSYFTVATTAVENCSDNIDNDGDGLVDCNDSDCKPKSVRLVSRN